MLKRRVIHLHWTRWLRIIIHRNRHGPAGMQMKWTGNVLPGCHNHSNQWLSEENDHNSRKIAFCKACGIKQNNETMRCRRKCHRSCWSQRFVEGRVYETTQKQLWKSCCIRHWKRDHKFYDKTITTFFSKHGNYWSERTNVTFAVQFVGINISTRCSRRFARHENPQSSFR